jgi:hypothetical protein
MGKPPEAGGNRRALNFQAQSHSEPKARNLLREMTSSWHLPVPLGNRARVYLAGRTERWQGRLADRLRPQALKGF